MTERYVLESSSREHERLDLQGLIYRAATERALRDSGIGKGMRVLDIGCGSGDVSCLLAALVGPEGGVVGIDRDETAIGAARSRVSREGLTNADFLVADIDCDLPGAPFDAFVGRFILMHQADPVALLAHCAGAVSPGGAVVMVESHLAGLLTQEHSRPFSRLYDRIVRWQCRVIEAAGADIRSGLGLREAFISAGLGAPVIRMEAPVEGGPDSPLYAYLAESTANMMAMADECGIDGFSPDEVSGLAEQLRKEVVECNGTLMGWPVVSGWTRIPYSLSTNV